MMDGSEHQEAINLSSAKETTDNMMNGDVLKNGDSAHESLHQESLLANSDRDVKMEAGLLHMADTQQLQQLMPKLSQAHQLQQLMQHQSLVLQHQQQQKLQEQVIQELNEQLQVNLLQQSKLLQQPEKLKNAKSQQQLTQLALQQQQLVQQIQQLQLQQRQFLLACLTQPLVGVNQGMMSPVEIQQLWKEVAAQSGLQDENKSHFNGLTSTRSQSLQALPTWTNSLTNHVSQISGQSSQTKEHVTEKEDSEPRFTTLYRHGMCKWPGCDVQCENYKMFLRHINEEHQLDDKSTAQARVQMQVVSQLDIQLTREKELLQEMTKHLHMNTNEKNGNSEEPVKARPHVFINNSAELPASPKSASTITVPSPSKLTPVITTKPSLHLSASAPPTPLPLVTNQIPLPSIIPPQLGHPRQSTSLSQPSTPTSIGPMRRRVSDKCNLPISAEIQRNRDFYKNTDVRPPFTYASLIRQAIIESQHKQLTLNEIYQWFQRTFSYFRRNEATWKNAVRHNLSLHKCFMRVEDVKGAVWTVDEVEFYKRRPQKLGGNMSLREIPSPGSDPVGFGDTLNESLRAAIEQANMEFMNSQNCVIRESSLDSAEDLSMKSSRHESTESLSRTDFPSREDIPAIKEVVIEESEVMDSPPMENSYVKEEESEEHHRRMEQDMSLLVPSNHSVVYKHERCQSPEQS